MTSYRREETDDAPQRTDAGRHVIGQDEESRSEAEHKYAVNPDYNGHVTSDEEDNNILQKKAVHQA